MLTLGIESSCDETSVSVTSGRTVLSNIVSSSVHLHKKYGGVVPEIASRFHVEFILEVLEKALKDSRKKLKDVELIAVTNGPGLVGALLIGVSLAKSLSYSLKVPLIGVNHVLAHLYSAFLSGEDIPDFPFAGLVVSGGHTALFLCDKSYKQKLLGQTQDDAAGEAFDKVAKILKLGYPGGPAIEKRARLAKNKGSIKFPRTFLGKDSLDFSFSGIKTAVLYYVRNRDSGPSEINDICYAFQENALDTLVEKAFLAARLCKVKNIIVGGGVAANSRLREKFLDASKFSGGVRTYFPKMEYCMDNAAMVGVLGEELYKRGHRSDLYLSAQPNLEVVNA
ncbi:MAG: tRNA (adenosine(37)-N6)-threonylcarbamoyltransferase complex transferase subunit TsaD [Candidatus Omnitrophota bacterium]|nr:tRNA (adenosine(37)-N6)-threonylcarbamoyltransferase complex transferase subunit TsaD [Candidatus Omnitrophota bacterium]